LSVTVLVEPMGEPVTGSMATSVDRT
jgi:hypothetical protein